MSVPGQKRGPYKPRAAKSSAQAREDLPGAQPTNPRNDEPTLDGLDLGLVAGGVSAAWLGHVFGHDKNTIKKKLAKCRVAGMGPRGTPLYLIKEAAAWLVPPKVDLMTYIKGLRQQDLPPQLNKDYWGAMKIRQQVLQEAGETWRTPDVLRVFGEAAIQIKDTVSLWADEIERVQGLSPEAHAMLTRLTDGLMNEIHQVFVTAPSRSQTPNTVSEHDFSVESKPSVSEELDELV